MFLDTKYWETSVNRLSVAMQFVFILLILNTFCVHASQNSINTQEEFSQQKLTTPATNPGQSQEKITSISANPATVNSIPGTGWLGEQMGLNKDHGFYLGGLWMADANYLTTGGKNPHTFSFNNLLLVSFGADFEKILSLPGATFNIQYLQYNGQPTNQRAGSVQGYNSMDAGSPLNRYELYQLWWRQALFDDKLIFRVGKSSPSDDFNNVLKPVSTSRADHTDILSLSGLIFTPVFVNPTLLGVLPGYYNTEYGITMSFAPNENFYANYGVYAGQLAKGVQTGLDPGLKPNGYYFNIAEIGTAWTLGVENKPGSIGLGGWLQTGMLSASKNNTTIQQDGAKGLYLFAAQRLWLKNPGVDNSGISSFIQWGINNAKTLPVNDFVGFGLSGFGLIPNRPVDSIGFGLAWSKLNNNIFENKTELMFQVYYQAHLFSSVFLESAVTYIPSPGAAPNLGSAVPFTLRLITLF